MSRDQQLDAIAARRYNYATGQMYVPKKAEPRV
jgi:hypothetical protein